MNNKSALIGLMMLMIAGGCTSSDKTADYQNEAASGDNLTKTDNSTRPRTGYLGFLPFFLGGSSNSAVSGAAPATQGAERNAQNNAQNNNQNQGRQSDLKARGSKSFLGSSGS